MSELDYSYDESDNRESKSESDKSMEESGNEEKYDYTETESEGQDMKDEFSSSSSNTYDDEDSSHSVEKIVGRRLQNGQIEYKIKWVGYKSDRNSWQPSSNIKNQQLIDEYNDRIDKKLEIVCSEMLLSPMSSLSLTEDESSTTNYTSISRTISVDSTDSHIATTEVCNYFKNHEADKILGTCGLDVLTGEILLVVKWRNEAHFGVLKISIVRKYFPEMLIQYYEDHLRLY